MDLAIFILISAFARWGACVIVHYAKTETPVFIRPYNRWITTLGGFLFVKAYMLKCIRLFRPQFRKVKIRFVVEIP